MHSNLYDSMTHDINHVSVSIREVRKNVRTSYKWSVNCIFHGTTSIIILFSNLKKDFS